MGVTAGSAEARVEAAIAATKRLNPTLRAYLHVDLEGARAEAAEVEALEAAGARPGPLAGMPVCVKDIVDVAGMPTTAGGADWVRHPEEDATVVARLRDAGAVVVGKGNTNEFACGIDGRNPHKGDCRNPWDPARLTGGSSSGPAAAVAAGMADGAIGSDTSGSIRVPAALCGVVGIRPTRGLVPAEGVVPLAWSLDAVGPLARDVASAALLLDVLAGRPPAPAPRPEVAGLRLGVATSLMALADAPVADALGGRHRGPPRGRRRGRRARDPRPRTGDGDPPDRPGLRGGRRARALVRAPAGPLRARGAGADRGRLRHPRRGLPARPAPPPPLHPRVRGRDGRARRDPRPRLPGARAAARGRGGRRSAASAAPSAPRSSPASPRSASSTARWWWSRPGCARVCRSACS